MQFANLNGWRIAYEDRGKGPVVFLAHGLLMDHTVFDRQVDVLASKYRVITPDLRNHGASEKRAEDHSQWDMMRDHIALCDLLGVERAVFGGQSQGGFQVLRAALEHPDRVAGLILIDTQAGPEDPVKAGIYSSIAEVVAEDGWNEIILDSVASILFGRDADPILKSNWTDKWRTEVETATARETLAAVTARDDLSERLSEIEAPALVIHGVDDAAIEIERAEQMAHALPALVDLVKVEGAGHTANLEASEQVNPAIERFLGMVIS